jgi:hypothetical protein
MNSAYEIEACICSWILHLQNGTEQAILKSRGVQLGNWVRIGVGFPRELMPFSLNKEPNLSCFVWRSRRRRGYLENFFRFFEECGRGKRIQLQNEAVVGKNPKLRSREIDG